MCISKCTNNNGVDSKVNHIIFRNVKKILLRVVQRKLSLMYNLASEVYSANLHRYLNRCTSVLWYNNLCKLPF